MTDLTQSMFDVEAGATLAERVVEVNAGEATLWMLPTEARDVVSFKGSFETAPDLSTDDDLAQHLLADLLDKGTQRKDRFEIAEALEGRGAQLSFYPSTLRSGFSGKVLKEDLPDVLALLAEQLREPALDADMFSIEQAKAIAGVQHAMDSTASQASGALKRYLFPGDHPNNVRTLEEELASLEQMTVDDVRAFHVGHFGSNGFNIAFAGDLDPTTVEKAVQFSLGDWPQHQLSAQFAPEADVVESHRTDVPMQEKQNLDIRMGHSLALRRDDDEFLPLYVGNRVLGGNFSARLMQVVRDEMGLTYGIGSSLAGMSVKHTGYWRIDVSLSAENLERGIEATSGVVEDFVSGGITEEELEEKKTTISGNHVVAMATTGGLATRLLVNAERGFPVSYLDEYTGLIQALTLDQTNRSIQKHLDPAALSMATAGSLPLG